MTGTRQVVGVLLVSVMLVLAGCAGTLDADEEIDGDAVLEGIEETESYQYELTQTVVTDDADVETTIEGAVDQSNESAYASVDVGTSALDATDGIETYVVDGVQYTQIAGTWTKLDLPDDQVWQEVDVLDDHESILAESEELTVNGTATVDGVETAVVEVTVPADAIEDALEEVASVDADPFGEEPIDDDLDDAVENEFDDADASADATDDPSESADDRNESDAELTDGDAFDVFDEDVLDDQDHDVHAYDDVEFDDVAYTLYVDQSTDLLHKVELSMAVESAGESVAIETEMTFSNHGEDVGIELPPEAEDAKTFSEWFDSVVDEWDEELGEWEDELDEWEDEWEDDLDEWEDAYEDEWDEELDEWEDEFDDAYGDE